MIQDYKETNKRFNKNASFSVQKTKPDQTGKGIYVYTILSNTSKRGAFLNQCYEIVAFGNENVKKIRLVEQ